MTMLRVLIAALVATAVLVVAPGASAASKSCGSITFSGTKTTVYKLRGVSCKQAKRVARAYDDGRAPGDWMCALARQGDEFKGRQVGFSCGAGGTRGDLRKFPSAFLGLI